MNNLNLDKYLNIVNQEKEKRGLTTYIPLYPMLRVENEKLYVGVMLTDEKDPVWSMDKQIKPEYWVLIDVNEEKILEFNKTAEKDFVVGNFIPKNNDIFIVDPYSYLPNGKNIYELTRTFCQLIGNFKSIKRLIRKYKQENPFTINWSKVGIGRLLLVTKTYVLLKKICEEDVIWKARYITQWYMNSEYPTDESRFKRAYELLQLYTGAKYVITSRIHCAFPCLGLQTPVAFVKNNAGGEKSTCRLGSILELLNVVELDKENVVSNFLKDKKFSMKTTFTNKQAYLDNRNKLIQKCIDFINLQS